jgi:hypothetical protein
MERLRISLIQSFVTKIVFRDLPPVSRVERQLEMQFRDRLLDDELEELPHLIDEASTQLFGITQRDTFYWALPERVRGKYSRTDWEAHFDVVWEFSKDPNAHWSAFGLDIRCPEGGRLHCFEVFGRQLICALERLHPKAVLLWESKNSEAA